ncbi:MAG: hypothetical protein J6X16_02215 [Bacteroidales bacterium]|nr:hypothetical protein [Bacteroidales bacterium]
MKKMILVLAATLICGACFFTSCKKEKDKDNTDLNLKENIIGTWITADKNGQPMPTNEKLVYTFVSTTKALVSASLTHPEIGSHWSDQYEANITISDNKVTINMNLDEHTTAEEEYTVTAINGSEFTANHKVTIMVDGNVLLSDENVLRLVKQTVYYKQDILGTWEGHCTSTGSVFDDGQEHRWKYKADGTYVYFVKDGDNWISGDNTLNEYFVDGTLLCTRWIDNGVENREWWEISIKDNQMHWTATRQNDDGSTFTATFEMEKIK